MAVVLWVHSLTKQLQDSIHCRLGLVVHGHPRSTSKQGHEFVDSPKHSNHSHQSRRYLPPKAAVFVLFSHQNGERLLEAILICSNCIPYNCINLHLKRTHMLQKFLHTSFQKIFKLKLDGGSQIPLPFYRCAGCTQQRRREIVISRAPCSFKEKAHQGSKIFHSFPCSSITHQPQQKTHGVDVFERKDGGFFNGSIMSNGMVENGQLSQKTVPKNKTNWTSTCQNTRKQQETSKSKSIKKQTSKNGMDFPSAMEKPWHCGSGKPRGFPAHDRDL